MVGLRFSLIVDLGLGAAASRALSYHHGPTATVGWTSEGGLAPSRRPGRVPFEPLRAGPLEPEREARHQSGAAFCRWEER